MSIVGGGGFMYHALIIFAMEFCHIFPGDWVARTDGWPRDGPGRCVDLARRIPSDARHHLSPKCENLQKLLQRSFSAETIDYAYKAHWYMVRL